MIDRWEEAVTAYEMREKLPKGWDKRKCDDVFGGFVYIDEDLNEFFKNEYGRFELIS